MGVLYTTPMDPDTRWRQRLSNYEKALANLSAAVALSATRPLSQLEQQGLIQAFEFTHELAWNVMKDWFEDQGTTGITGSKDATRQAFSQGLIAEGQVWMDMIKGRNLSSHTYNAETASLLSTQICQDYEPAFQAFFRTMKAREVQR